MLIITSPFFCKDGWINDHGHVPEYSGVYRRLN